MILPTKTVAIPYICRLSTSAAAGQGQGSHNGLVTSTAYREYARRRDGRRPTGRRRPTQSRVRVLSPHAPEDSFAREIPPHILCPAAPADNGRAEGSWVGWYDAYFTRVTQRATRGRAHFFCLLPDHPNSACYSIYFPLISLLPLFMPIVKMRS